MCPCVRARASVWNVGAVLLKVQRCGVVRWAFGDWGLKKEPFQSKAIQRGSEGVVTGHAPDLNEVMGFCAVMSYISQDL